MSQQPTPLPRELTTRAKRALRRSQAQARKRWSPGDPRATAGHAVDSLLTRHRPQARHKGGPRMNHDGRPTALAVYVAAARGRSWQSCRKPQAWAWLCTRPAAGTGSAPSRSFLLGPGGPAGAPPGQCLRSGGYMAASRSGNEQDPLNQSVHASREPRPRIFSIFPPDRLACSRAGR